jgi:hypothetical protein
MDLNNLIPDKFRPLVNPTWVVKGKFVMFKKYEHIPVCFVEDDIVYVFLDNRVTNAIIKLVKHLISSGVEFYFTTPELSNPKGFLEEDYHDKVIRHYLYSHAQVEFFDGFKKIDFDLIDNMVKWTDKENCFDKVKANYESISKKVERKEYDHFSNNYSYEYKDEIREEFQSLYRHIQISKII